MSRRLYLSDRNRYRLRFMDAHTCVATWDDAGRRFVAGRGYDRRLVDTDQIAAVAAFAPDGRARPVWVPFDCCYREMHRPRTQTAAWVHPYARQARAA